MEHIPGPQHKLFKYIEDLKVFIKLKIQEHKETLDPNSPRDYIDCFLLRMEQVLNILEILIIIYQSVLFNMDHGFSGEYAF